MVSGLYKQNHFTNEYKKLRPYMESYPQELGTILVGLGGP